MQIAIGSDHRGVTAKARLVARLEALGHIPQDVGVFQTQSIDYPDIAAQVAQQVSQGAAQRGILICSTGIGMSIAANKLPGVRAAAIFDDQAAEMSRRHNDLNVLCLSADLLDPAQLERLVEIHLSTPFEGGRHARRVEKIQQLEQARGDSSARKDKP